MSKYYMYLAYPVLILSFQNDFQRTVLQPEGKKGKFGTIYRYMMRKLMNPNTDCSDYFQ